MGSVEATLTIETEVWKARGNANSSYQLAQLTEVIILREQVTMEGNFITLSETQSTCTEDGTPIGQIEMVPNDTSLPNS